MMMRIGAHDSTAVVRPRSTIAIRGVERAMGTTSACVEAFRLSMPIHFSVVATMNGTKSFGVRRVGRTFCPPLF